VTIQTEALPRNNLTALYEASEAVSESRQIKATNYRRGHHPVWRCAGAATERIVVSAGGQVETGQRYRVVRVGGAPSTVWEVVRIYRPWPGCLEHACLRSVDRSAGTMTLATSVVADTKRFVPEG
jgi:hypothetical protein